MLKQRPPHKGGPARFVTGEKGAEEGDEILFQGLFFTYVKLGVAIHIRVHVSSSYRVHS